jgi:eukaryotic-like serine/threonine-protein kinase
MIDKAIAHYRATARLGAGGMGEVYRATDARLGREVALKVLRSDLAQDVEGRARFEREARLLAGLQHSNIAVVHGFEEAEGVRALVMELVEGPTLADRVAQGPLPLEEALPIARQVAEALEYAHEHGIVHRDLKPANVKVTPDGVVKVLDFGLAKAVERELGPREAGASPTLTAASTAAGVILGTAAYMSPEQARGKPVDRRTDVWAFGCLLYEILSGRRAFAGDTVTDTLATILHVEPDWSALPAKTPATLRQLLKRCVEKDQRRRLQAIGEARLLLEELIQTSATGRIAPITEEVPATAPPGGDRRRLPWVAGALLGGLLLGALGAGLLRRAPEKPVSWLFLDLAPAEHLGEGRPRFQAFALSPDGRRIAFTGERAGKVDLYLRSLDRAEATVVPGTSGALSPFFSPDGRWLGFLADDALKKVAVEGGPVTTIAALAKGDQRGSSQVPPGRDVYGVAWGEGDRIFIGRFADGIWEVSASGGTPIRSTTIEGKSDTYAHRLPQPLPGRRGLLFTRCRNLNGDSDVAVLPESGEERVLVESASDGRFVAPGHLVFVREGVLHTAPFDLSRLAVTGPAVPVLEGVLHSTGSGSPARNSGAAQFAVSPSGTLVFARGGAQPLSRTRPVWLDRRGQAEPLKLPEGYYARPRLSPDGSRLAVTHTAEGRRETTRIWVLDLARGAFSPVPGEGFSSPVWTADGKRLVFRGTKPPGLYWAPADGTGEPELLREARGGVQMGSVSPDGALLAYVDRAPETSQDIWLLPLAGDRTPRPWLKTSASENHPELSPDGRWMAYSSNVSGRSEVYVQPFPGPEGSRHQVSLSGGQAPLWSRDGRELFFVTDARPRRLMAVDVRTSPAFSVGAARELVARDLSLPGGSSSYEASPDGRRFLVLEEVEAPDRTVADLQVVVNGLRLLTPGEPTR